MTKLSSPTNAPLDGTWKHLGSLCGGYVTFTDSILAVKAFRKEVLGECVIYQLQDKDLFPKPASLPEGPSLGNLQVWYPYSPPSPYPLPNPALNNCHSSKHPTRMANLNLRYGSSALA